MAYSIGEKTSSPLEKWMKIIGAYSENGKILIEYFDQVPMNLTDELHNIMEQINTELHGLSKGERKQTRKCVEEKNPNLIENFDFIFKRAMES